LNPAATTQIYTLSLHDALPILAYDFGMGSMPEDADDPTPRKLTHEQARAEQRLYWSKKSASERYAAMRALTRRMNAMREIFIDERNPDLTPRFVRRRKG